MAEIPSDYFFSKQRFTLKQYLDIYPAVDPSTAALSQAGRVVIITGASRGLGSRGIAPAFATAGVKGIVIVAMNTEKLKAVEKDLNSQYPSVRTIAISADVSNEASVRQLFEQIKTEFGHADILINNAAVSSGGGIMHEEDVNLWWRNFEVNVRGSFLCAKYFLQQLPSPSAPANIVNVVSNAAWEVFPSASGYSLSKLAVVQLTAHLAAAYPQVTTTALHPGFMDTEMLYDHFRHMKQTSPELAGGVSVWLCTKPAQILRGRAIAADWDVEELLQRKSGIENENILRMELLGTFGPEQFERD